MNEASAIKDADRALTPQEVLARIKEMSAKGFVANGHLKRHQNGTGFASRSLIKDDHTAADLAAEIIGTESPERAADQPADVRAAPAAPVTYSQAELDKRLETARIELSADYERRIQDMKQNELDALSTARSAFLSLTNRLQNVTTADIEDLGAAMAEAIRRLASERAGSAIDGTPEAFLERIMSMAHALGTSTEALTLSLNPADFAAIEPHIGDEPQLAENRIRIDLSLGRGDIRISAGGISMDDVIASVTPPMAPPAPARKKAAK
ncbi:MAG: hypothetical protein JJ872_11795 [Marivivens sp.]|nr:hypothetical protein [Marivivens sp.]